MHPISHREMGHGASSIISLDFGKDTSFSQTRLSEICIDVIRKSFNNLDFVTFWARLSRLFALGRSTYG